MIAYDPLVVIMCLVVATAVLVLAGWMDDWRP